MSMRKLTERFFDWIFHPSVRRDPLPRGKANLYRYPSPGSIIPEEAPADYRTPFTDTKYDIRRANFTHAQTEVQSSQFHKAPTRLTAVQKLKLLGFLAEGEENNATAVQEAENKFKQIYGFDIKKNVYKNDFELTWPEGLDREGYRQFVASQLVADALYYKQNANYGDEELANNPNIMSFQSLDLYDAPHFQQGRIELAYTLDSICNMRADAEGGIDVRKGEANFWKALDDSNDPNNVRKVQGKIGDPEPNNFNLKDTKIKFEFDEKGDVVDIRRRDD